MIDDDTPTQEFNQGLGLGTVFAIIGEDAMNYEFNKTLLINEYDIKIKHKIKHLALDWNPIIIDDVVNKLMVSVRDVTQLKQAEGEALAQKLGIQERLQNAEKSRPKPAPK